MAVKKKARKPAKIKAAKKQWGGPRRGAGRKTIGDVPMIRTNIMLDRETISKAHGLGDGNVSAGVRKALTRIKAV